MKKTLLLVAASLFIAKATIAQDMKSVRFGIRATPAINWMTPSNDKKVQKGGAVMKAGIGLVLEFKLSDVASFQTGLEYTGAGFKAKYQGSDTAMYLYKDDAIYESNGVKETDSTLRQFQKDGGTIYHLTARKYNIGYLNIPLTFKLKTKDIGGLTYFGQIGGNLFFKTGAKGNDDVKKLLYNTTGNANGTEETIAKNDIGKSVNLLTAAGSIGGGVEYNISGSTSLYGSLHYQHHFMNATAKDNDYLLNREMNGSTGTYKQFQNAVKLRQFVIAVGVLF